MVSKLCTISSVPFPLPWSVSTSSPLHLSPGQRATRSGVTLCQSPSPPSKALIKILMNEISSVIVTTSSPGEDVNYFWEHRSQKVEESSGTSLQTWASKPMWSLLYPSLQPRTLTPSLQISLPESSPLASSYFPSALKIHKFSPT